MAITPEDIAASHARDKAYFDELLGPGPVRLKFKKSRSKKKGAELALALRTKRASY